MSITIEVGELDTSQIATEGITHRTLDFQRWYVCTQCGHQAPASKMGLMNGKPYCLKYGCYQDELHERQRRARVTS